MLSLKAMRVRNLSFLGLFLIVGTAIFFNVSLSSANETDLYALFRQGDYETIISLKPEEGEELFSYLVSLLNLVEKKRSRKRNFSLSPEKDYFWLDQFFIYLLHCIENET